MGVPAFSGPARGDGGPQIGGVFDENTYYLTRNFLGADAWLRIRAGDIVFRWSTGRIFLQMLHALSVGPGEKNYTLQFQLLDAQRNPLPAGVYTAEAWLTTDGPQPYRAQVAFENRPGK